MPPSVASTTPRRLVICGLGNWTHPLTRHSIGQLLLKNLALRAASSPHSTGSGTLLATKTGHHTSWTTRITLAPPERPSLELLFVLPKALMNVSGPTAIAAMNGFLPPLAAPSPPSARPPAASDEEIPPAKSNTVQRQLSLKPMHRLLTLQDDLDLPPLTLKPQRGGGPRGHNGVRSISSSLSGSRDFHRLRIGIGRPEERSRVANYVLSALGREEVRACEWDEDKRKGGEVLERAWEEVLRIGYEEE
ncbi:hypothetical protein JCM1841_001314 [Sporobolomyces salmonicolor]